MAEFIYTMLKATLVTLFTHCQRSSAYLHFKTTISA